MADTATPQRLAAVDLIEAVIRKAAEVKAESDAACRFAEGTDIHAWHMERGVAATNELLDLITAPEHAAVWQRIAGVMAPAWPLRMGSAA
jgi:hypothetical protein